MKKIISDLNYKKCIGCLYASKALHVKKSVIEDICYILGVFLIKDPIKIRDFFILMKEETEILDLVKLNIKIDIKDDKCVSVDCLDRDYKFLEILLKDINLESIELKNFSDFDKKISCFFYFQRFKKNMIHKNCLLEVFNNFIIKNELNSFTIRNSSQGLDISACKNEFEIIDFDVDF